jgi:hypothetical protein
LDLKGLHVLTEAATGYYILTPLIAALAGADRVYALTRDSRYGKASKVCNETKRLARLWSSADRIDVLYSRDDRRIEQADIVTNLGFVRPLDAKFLRRLKSTAVIPLMWEAWEYRPEDIDLNESRRLGIPVLGTNEHHPDLQVFKYVGMLAVKLLFELEIEVYRSNIVIIGSGEFVDITKNILQALGASVMVFDPRFEQLLGPERTYNLCKSADALIILEHLSRKVLIGSQGLIRPETLRTLNPGLAIVHICGGVDRETLDKLGFHCHPSRFAPTGYMSVATDYLGPRPLVDLHTAGLKVGELMWRKKEILKDARKVEQVLAKEHPLCQCLPDSRLAEGEK